MLITRGNDPLKKIKIVFNIMLKRYGGDHLCLKQIRRIKEGSLCN